MKAPQAKNAIARALRSTIDPELTPAQKKLLHAFFGGRCAYCDEASADKMHRDHLVPSALGGPNHLSNRVLACPSCNGDEKRERPWRDFLKAKLGDNAGLFQRREARILEWQTQVGPAPTVSAPIIAALGDALRRLNTAFDTELAALKELSKQTK